MDRVVRSLIQKIIAKKADKNGLNWVDDNLYFDECGVVPSKRPSPIFDDFLIFLMGFFGCAAIFSYIINDFMFVFWVKKTFGKIQRKGRLGRVADLRFSKGPGIEIFCVWIPSASLPVLSVMRLKGLPFWHLLHLHN